MGGRLAAAVAGCLAVERGQMEIGLGFGMRGAVYICWAVDVFTIGLCVLMGREYISGPPDAPRGQSSPRPRGGNMAPVLAPFESDPRQGSAPAGDIAILSAPPVGRDRAF
jgi:hypothetical protein